MKKKNIQNSLKRLLLALTFIAIIAVFFIGSRYLIKKQEPKYKAEKALVKETGQIKRILFSPDNDVQEVLLGLIDEEKEKISIATFIFTNKALIKALINAKKRGVKIEIVADGQQNSKEYSQINNLSKVEIPIYIYPNEESTKKLGIMHHKFMIFSKSFLGKSIIATGSYNFTKSANERNQENIIITDDTEIIELFKKQFEILKSRCKMLETSKN